MMEGRHIGILAALWRWLMRIITALFGKRVKNVEMDSMQAQDSDVRYERKPLLSKGELAFFWVLLRSCPDSHRVLCKVRLGDLIRVAWAGSYKTKLAKSNGINQKHVDFVLLNRDTAVVDVVIELDDKTHNRPDRAKRDAFVHEALRVRRLRLDVRPCHPSL